jgi:hypothetical protein
LCVNKIKISVFSVVKNGVGRCLTFYFFFVKLLTIGNKIFKGGVEMEEKKIGVITHYFGHISVGIIKLDAPLKVGDKIHIKGVHDDVAQSVDSMQIEHESVDSADKGAEVGIKVVEKVHPHDEVYLVA